MPVIKSKKHSQGRKPATTRAARTPVLDEAVIRHAHAIARDPKKAKQFLVDAGIITKSGSLTANYK